MSSSLGTCQMKDWHGGLLQILRGNAQPAFAVPPRYLTIRPSDESLAALFLMVLWTQPKWRRPRVLPVAFPA